MNKLTAILLALTLAAPCWGQPGVDAGSRAMPLLFPFGVGDKDNPSQPMDLDLWRAQVWQASRRTPYAVWSGPHAPPEGLPRYQPITNDLKGALR